MSYIQGIAFRATAGYVTDGPNDYYELGDAFNPTYPHTTAQGNTVGWEGTMANTRDRNNGIDVRLAGINFTSGAQRDFRFDLPSTGSYNIRLAGGDAGGGNPSQIDLYDTTTLLAHLCSGTPAAAHFFDATGTDYSAAAWPGSNSILNVTFTTTIARFRLVNNGSTNVIAYAYIEAAGAPPSGQLFRTPLLNGLGAGGPFFNNPLGRHRQPGNPQPWAKVNGIYRKAA